MNVAGLRSQPGQPDQGRSVHSKSGSLARLALISKACFVCICSVVGVPKSIDNDILLIDKTFG